MDTEILPKIFFKIQDQVFKLLEVFQPRKTKNKMEEIRFLVFRTFIS